MQGRLWIKQGDNVYEMKEIAAEMSRELRHGRGEACRMAEEQEPC